MTEKYTIIQGLLGRPDTDSIQVIHLHNDDPENPRAWRRWRKLANVLVISSMASTPSIFHSSDNNLFLTIF